MQVIRINIPCSKEIERSEDLVLECACPATVKCYRDSGRSSHDVADFLIIK